MTFIMNKNKRDDLPNRACSVYCLKDSIHVDGNISRLLNCNSIYAKENGKKVKVGLVCDTDCEILKNIVKKKYPPVPRDGLLSFSLFNANTGAFQGHIKYIDNFLDSTPKPPLPTFSSKKQPSYYSSLFLDTPKGNNKGNNDIAGLNKQNYQYKMGEFTICDNLWQGTPNNIFQLIKKYDMKASIEPSIIQVFRVEEASGKKTSNYIHFNVPYYIYIERKGVGDPYQPIRIYLRQEEGRISIVYDKEKASQWMFLNANRDTYNMIQNTSITYNKRFYISIYPFKEHSGKFLKWNDEGNFQFVVNVDNASTFSIPSLDSENGSHGEECNDCIFQEREYDTNKGYQTYVNKEKANITDISSYTGRKEDKVFLSTPNLITPDKRYDNRKKDHYKREQSKIKNENYMVRSGDREYVDSVKGNNNHLPRGINSDDSIESRNISSPSRNNEDDMIENNDKIKQNDTLEKERGTTDEDGSLKNQIKSRPVAFGIGIFTLGILTAGIVTFLLLHFKKKKKASKGGRSMTLSSPISSTLPPPTIFTSKIKTKNAYFPSFTLHTPNSNDSTL